jgi:hypothetical protein
MKGAEKRNGRNGAPVGAGAPARGFACSSAYYSNPGSFLPGNPGQVQVHRVFTIPHIPATVKPILAILVLRKLQKLWADGDQAMAGYAIVPPMTTKILV